MGVRTRRTLLLLPVLILLLTFFPMELAQEDPATLRISLLGGTVRGSDSDPWLNEGWLLNLTGSSWEFTVRVNETSNVHTSYETHLIVALNDFAYSSLDSLSINDTDIPKAAFQSGIPEPYNLGWGWPDDVYPTRFNDTYYLGPIQPFGYTEVNVSVNFLWDPTGARMHFDAYGKIVPGPPQDIGDFTWSPNSEDATVVSAETPCGTPPHAEFTYSPTYPIVGENVTFNASKSYDPDGYIVNYTWNFGDNNFTTVTDPIVDHHYTMWQYENYTVTLKVTDNNTLPLDGYATANVTVLDTELPVFVEVWREPETPAYNETVTVKANVTDEGSGVESVILSYSNDTITWTNVTMNLAEGLYVGEIPPFPYGTTVDYKIYAYDNAGNLAIEITHSWYNVTDPYPPVIGVPTWDPEEPSAGQEVTVFVSVSEPADASGVKNVTLWYRTDDQFESIEMTNTTLENWNATIPDQSAGVNVTFYIESYDNAGNNASTPTYNYTVKALSPGPPVAIFTYLPLTPPTGENVTFNATASYDPNGTIVSYAWDFGDNTTGAGNITTHSYTDNGTYTVTLNVTDNDGLSNATSADITVLNRPPVAMFNESATTVDIGEIIYFNASDSYDPDGNITSYFWDFGDGTNTTGKIVNHTYTAAGIYTVNLTVTDDDNLTNSTSKSILIEKSPAARFTYSPDKPLVGELVIFNASASTPDGGTIDSYFWDFDDGANGTGMIVNHTYTAHGTYTVTLNVTDTEGLWDTNSTMVKVYAPPVVTFTVSPAPPWIACETVTFNASASYDPDGTIFSWNWTIKKDNVTIATYSGSVVSHHFTEAGNYTVTLTVTDNDGLTDTSTLDVTVIDYPVAKFTFSPAPPYYYVPVTLTFDASGSTPNGGIIISYEWNFGDGNVTTVTDPIVTHTYTTFGIYTVALNVTDSEGLWNTTSEEITVHRRDVAVVDVEVEYPFGATEADGVYPGWVVNITVTVRNNGTVAESFTVSAYYDANVIGTQAITDLAPGAEKTLKFENWNTTDVAYSVSPYTINATASEVLYEIDTTNNSLTTTLLVKYFGDCDGSGGYVDVADLIIFLATWDKLVGDPDYDPRADFNGSGGYVDVADLVIFVKYWSTKP